MSQWVSGDTLDSVTLNARMASATSTTGFSTNTLSPESGNTLSVVSGTLSLQSDLRFTPTVSRVVPGATSLAVRNASNTTDNFLVTDSGGVTIRSTIGMAGAAPRTDIAILAQNVLTGSDFQAGLVFFPTFDSGAVSQGRCIALLAATQAAAFVCPELIGLNIQGPARGSGSTVVVYFGIKLDGQSMSCTTSVGMVIGATSGGTVSNQGLLIGNVTGTGAAAISTGAGTVTLGDLLDVSASTIRLRTSGTPTGLGSGNTGDIKWDTNYVYVCTSVNSWSRATLNRF